MGMVGLRQNGHKICYLKWHFISQALVGLHKSAEDQVAITLSYPIGSGQSAGLPTSHFSGRSDPIRTNSIRIDPVWLLGGNWSITESTSPCVAVLWTSFSRPATDNLHKYEAKFRRELKWPKMWLHLCLATELGSHTYIRGLNLVVDVGQAGMKNGRNAFSVNFMLSFDL